MVSIRLSNQTARCVKSINIAVYFDTVNAIQGHSSTGKITLKVFYSPFFSSDHVFI